MYKICKQHKIYNIRNILHLLILPQCKGKKDKGLLRDLDSLPWCCGKKDQDLDSLAAN